MNISVEISYYPLDESYVEHILAFLERMKSHPGLVLQTNGMSTQVFGEYDTVMAALTREVRQSFEQPHSVFVMKVVNAHLQK
jgi:uncharacterized protein YqgV (UPF0045/DUF77 family)